ncbi:MAG: hypothetical protein HZA50_04095 [Planctomycetes bacterium]|nr:hypothetical protein [Planctomycetota bacterium]
MAYNQTYINMPTRRLDLKYRGEYETALELLHEHLMDNPDDYDALTDAGYILFCLGRIQEANRHFQAAARKMATRNFGPSEYVPVKGVCFDVSGAKAVG